MPDTTSYYRLPAQRAPARLPIVLTGLSVAILGVTLAASTVDTRLLEGMPVWAKPIKFALSFVVLFVTIAWLDARLSPRWRDGWLLRATLAVMGTALVAEMGYLVYQAAQAEASHYNLSTPFHAFMYNVVMFSGALALVGSIGIYGLAAALDRGADLTSNIRRGVVWGFGLTFVLTMIVAGYMGGQESRFVGTPSADAATVPLVGWSAQVGDLRPAHFLALHAMQVLPVFGWLLDRLHRGDARRWIALAAVVYAITTLALFAQALAGQPLVAL